MKLYTLIGINGGIPCVALNAYNNDLAFITQDEQKAAEMAQQMSQILGREYYYQSIDEILKNCDKTTEKNIKRYLRKFERFCNKQSKVLARKEV